MLRLRASNSLEQSFFFGQDTDPVDGLPLSVRVEAASSFRGVTPRTTSGVGAAVIAAPACVWMICFCALCSCGSESWGAAQIDASNSYLERTLVPALRSYCRDKGTFPAALEDLVPRYVHSVASPSAGNGSWRYRVWDVSPNLVYVDRARYERLKDVSRGSLQYLEIVFGVGDNYYPCEGFSVLYDPEHRAFDVGRIVNY